MYAGVDEAGRGPVLGPLVVAGVCGPPDALPDGIRDSKALTSDQRERLYVRLERKDTLEIAIRSIPARELNERMAGGENLNEIETSAFASILEELGAARAVVDTIGTDADAFGEELSRRLSGSCQVTARKQADATDPLVGAASIVAKVTRDAAIHEIEGTFGRPIGSGYPSDPTTQAFLEAWRADRLDPPPHARTAWSTIRKLGFGAPTLEDYTG